MRHLLLVAFAVAAAALGAERAAHACGCFVLPDATVPLVQAGERILFAREGGDVIAHIQIQYSGAAAEFGWLLPLPSVPDLQLGSDELFSGLIDATQPKYEVNADFSECEYGRESGCGGGDTAGSLYFSPPAGGGNPVVDRDSLGPYDYAVLRADSKQEMLDWLAENRYFVPAGTDDAVTPYIKPGAYFLALKLRPGKSTGDLQPVVVRYASDLPMIPIVLTSVAAQPDMGITVFMLGRARAIPRNFAHTVLNDAAIDWLGGAANYNDVVIRATREAAGRHTFITEYAGPSTIMSGAFGNGLRFGTRQALAQQRGIDALVAYLNDHGYLAPPDGTTPLYSSALAAILAAYAPPPPELGIPPTRFFPDLAGWRQRAPGLGDWNPTYDAQALADEIWERIVVPARSAAQLFVTYPYLTRLYTTLSPGDMTRDPVFTENSKLPDVSNVHAGRLIYHCGGDAPQRNTPLTLITEQGRRVYYPAGGPGRTPFATPGSLRIEALAEEGDPQTMVDNAPAIVASLPGGEPFPLGDSGCAVARGRAFGAGLLVLLFALRLRMMRR